MKNLFKLFAILLVAVTINSCTKDYDVLVINPKALTLASLNQASYGFVARTAFFRPNWMGTGSNEAGPFQLLHSLYFDIYANYWATTTPNFLSDRYVMVGNWLNGAFDDFYANEAPQVKYAVDFARANDLDPEFAMMLIWKVYIFARYTDCLGPIPYSQYGNMQKEVPYDKQQDIYAAFFLELDSAITILKANAGKTSATLSSYDPIYGGNLDKWQKFASSLRLRLAMRVKYVTPSVAKTQAEKAITEGVITSNADNGWMTSSLTFTNPYNTISPWIEYRMSADMESIMKGYADPRIASWFQPAKQPDKTDDPPGLVFDYEGVRNGQTKADRSTFALDALASDHSTPYTIVGDKGPNMYVMRAAEVYFLRAEGVLENWSMGGGTAEELYNTGITTSLDENGYTDHKNLLGEDYVTSTRVPYTSGIDKSTVLPPVAPAPACTVPIVFNAAGTKEEKLEQIITQKWISLFPNSQEAYAERRRTHYPKLFNRIESENPDVAATSLPVRLTYWTNEYNTNKKQVEAAIVLLNGESSTPNGDKASTKLWWDKKP